jgi:hypothetical protein
MPKNEATYNEITRKLTLRYKDGTKTTIKTLDARSVTGALELIWSEGFRATDSEWAYNQLDGYSIGIERA